MKGHISSREYSSTTYMSMKDEFAWEADVIQLMEPMLAECALIFKYKNKMKYIGNISFKVFGYKPITLVIGGVAKIEEDFQVLGLQ